MLLEVEERWNMGRQDTTGTWWSVSRREVLKNLLSVGVGLGFGIDALLQEGVRWQFPGADHDGLLHGCFVEKHQGMVTLAARFSHGWLHGPLRRWSPEDGRPWLSAHYSRGVRTGPVRVWHQDGQPFVVGKWADEYRGYEQTWSRDGRLIATSDLSTGNGVYEAWYQDEDNGRGGLFERGEVRDGKPVGVWQRYVAGPGSGGVITLSYDPAADRFTCCPCRRSDNTSHEHEFDWDLAATNRGYSRVRQPRALAASVFSEYSQDDATIILV